MHLHPGVPDPYAALLLQRPPVMVLDWKQIKCQFNKMFESLTQIHSSILGFFGITSPLLCMAGSFFIDLAIRLE
jgi:hypothetical protein